MAKINREYLFRLSAMDEEDAFDPADLSPEELFALNREASAAFVEQYKAYYDDITTSDKLHKEDW